MSDNDMQDDADKVVPENDDQSSTDAGKQKTAGSGSADGTPKGYVSEESYKGLQRAAEKQKIKLENELKAAKDALEAQTEEIEKTKLSVLDKQALEKKAADLDTSYKQLQAEKTKLERQLNQQSIVLAEFPELAPLAAFIPPAEDDAAFKLNAASFKTALKQYITITVQGNLSGASPAIGDGNGSENSEVIDALWTKVYSLAGVEGKEAEYEEANAKLQKLLKPQ